MLQRRISGNGVVYYVSPRLESLGVPHAFSTRVGGISPPPFDSLNLGNPNGCAVQDNYARIYQNYNLLQSAVGCTERKRCWIHQVHGGRVILIPRGGDFESGAKADAMVTDDSQRLLSVRVADCVPILIASHDGSTVAAVHCGWRGVIAEVVPAAVKSLGELCSRRLGVAPERNSFFAAIGPCIGIGAFEVGPEVIEQFQRAFNGSAPISSAAEGNSHVDLCAAVRLHLLQLGLPDDHIDTTDRCTHRDADEFFSHRRENGITGRMAALISPRS